MTKFHVGYTAHSAFAGGVGSKVTNAWEFLGALTKAVEAFNFNAETNPGVRTTGQGFVNLPEGLPFVVAGIGRKSDNPEHYTLRAWRGEVKPFLRREFAVQAETLAVIVYTVDAYLKSLSNPDTPDDVAKAERAALDESCTHVIVAVLAGAGPATLGPGRLVSNLAGGNDDALTWTADEIRQKAREAMAYSAEWSVVSD